MLFLTSVISRESDNSIDWKGLDFQTYCETILQPLLESRKFKPSFATQQNYQELERRIKEEINPLLSSLCSQFSSLTNLKDMNALLDNYLSKIFQGNVYGEAIHDELGKQLGIANHKGYKLEKTGNQSDNNSWNIALNEFAFKGGSVPTPEPFPKPNDEENPDNQDNPEEDNPNDNDNPNPEENPQPPQEKWETKRRRLADEARKEIDKASKVYDKDGSENIILSVTTNTELKDPSYYKKILDSKTETELNQIKEETLKDIAEIKLALPSERLKLKEYFIFWLFDEVKGLPWPDGTWNARHMEQSLMDDLNQVIKGNKNSTWQRKHMIFTGDFKINSKDKGSEFDQWKLDNSSLFIVIKKDHNQKQYHTERNSFFLRKGEPDYHEFKTRKEAIDWLRQNDSYFKS